MRASTRRGETPAPTRAWAASVEYRPTARPRGSSTPTACRSPPLRARATRAARGSGSRSATCATRVPAARTATCSVRLVRSSRTVCAADRRWSARGAPAYRAAAARRARARGTSSIRSAWAARAGRIRGRSRKSARSRPMVTSVASTSIVTADVDPGAAIARGATERATAPACARAAGTTASSAVAAAREVTSRAARPR